MFGGKKRNQDISSLEGVVTFFASHYALKADTTLKKHAMRSVLVPGPREISPNCGVALRFDYAEKDEVKKLFDENHIQFEEIHLYPVKR